MNFENFLSAQKKFPVFATFKIIPNAPKTEIFDREIDADFWKMRVRGAPENGKANAEIQKYFWKNFKISVKIISGKTYRRKLLKFEKS